MALSVGAETRFHGMKNDQSTSLVRVRDGKTFADSRDVASAFEKQHKHVLEAIRALDCPREFIETNFRPFKIKDLTGESTSHVEMTRDGFMFLAMGFTGAKAAAWKVKFIEAFNRMEAELSAAAVPNLRDPDVLLPLLASYAERTKELEGAVAEMAPKVVALDRLAGADGSMCITDAAKTLGISPIKNLFGFLQSMRWIYKRTGSANWLARQEKIIAGYMEHDDYVYRDDEGRDRVKTRALVTAKGLAKLAEMLGADDRQGDLLQ
jgi:Rha family phage regulatory protein